MLLVVALAVAGLAFAIGRFSAFGPTDAATTTPATDSPEAGFARDMQLHHAQAIDMAMTMHRKTADEDIRLLAYDIATTQSSQKGEFYDWLVRWGLPQAGGPLMGWMTDASTGHDHGAPSSGASDEAGLMASMGMATPEELAALDAATGAEADCLFLTLMIRHHEGALPMAEALVELGHDPRALQVADGVVATQSAEIDLMRALQLRLGCS